jgi:DNA-binding transcriptional LysR family regulator
MTKTAPKTADQRAAPPAKHALRPPRILLYVNAVARLGSIRKAAESLHIASSALNRRILDLEEEIGTPLFERLARGVRLTTAGELYVRYVRRSLADLEVVSSQIEQLQGLVRGRVKIAATESVAGRLLPDAIARFQQKHPGVYFNVTIEAAGQLPDALLDDAVDLVLTHDLYNRQDVSVLAVTSQPFCAMVAKDHPLAQKNSIRLRDCLDYPVALADESLAGRALIDRALSKTSFQFEPVLISNSVETMKAFAKLSQAVCFQFQIAGHADPDMVAIPLTDTGLHQTQLFMAMRRGRALPTAAAAFSQHMSALFDSI